ncbi:4-(cytidine 5'-diphospho)-2-C-methyl-D-erythritol kinase [Jatrophihabitans telluris]|uniref:4-diphosphocytidyl-2-C-methyl-D-erythritol kinase n=1 Tax=Jatrophihabitans telluris TaxID=2038343 RepID=A0ABY4R0P5_9ACTN|nr:4-(cytidine 5'-diphospho)-2-C-methyl-D-erythritol kinase [Jatrophihabitans telluris]UQX89345.1 4-(cytidine 5'-diphospho)-2-C-methyl-D-erythritol kinase [Jatrophihabitans telluris]
MSSIEVRAAAKINIHLGVGPRDSDGFHPIQTIYQAVSLYDSVRLTAVGPTPPADTDSVAVPTGPMLTVSGIEGADAPPDPTNLAWRALELLASHAGRTVDVTLALDKQIPVAAGLAGGSADAAAALTALAAWWRLDISDNELDALAAELGSDVTFARHGGTALGTGRGERLQPYPAGEFHWVLVASHGALSTPAVYAELDRQRETDTSAAVVERAGSPEPALRALAAGDPAALVGLLVNDLEPAAIALAPYLEATLQAGRAAGALDAVVSGSGPTCLFLAGDAAHAAELADTLSATPTARRVLAVHSPVRGAQLVESEL